MAEQAGQLNIEVVWVDPTQLDEVEAALEQHPQTALVYLESIANPTLAIADLPALVEMAHAFDAKVMVDNTFATPYHLKPLEWGADVAVHSTTKYISGHGTIIGGAVVADEALFEESGFDGFRKNLGGTPSPFDAWLTLNGLRTFFLRMERHAENAMKVAKYLENHPAVDRLFYPGLESHPQYEVAKKILDDGYGAMISCELKGGYEAGVHLMEHVNLFGLGVSLGNVDSLIQHPASMTHYVMGEENRKAAGIYEGLVRLSVGVEPVEDLIADLEQALKKFEQVQNQTLLAH